MDTLVDAGALSAESEQASYGQVSEFRSRSAVCVASLQFSDIVVVEELCAKLYECMSTS